MSLIEPEDMHHENDALAKRAAHQAVEDAEPANRRSTWFSHVLLPVVLSTIISVVLVGSTYLYGHHLVNQRTHELNSKVNANAQALAEANRRLRSVGQKPVPTPANGANGRQGETGPAGKGIAATSVQGGYLVIAYTDGSVERRGPIVGPTGKTGKAGPSGKAGTNGANGRGVTGSQVNPDTGHLLISYSDNTVEDVGLVVGSPGKDGANGKDGKNGSDGRGVQSFAISNGDLVVTYTDGSHQDIGPVPTGPLCPTGTHLAHVVFANGVTGQGCVDDGAAATPTTVPTTPVTTTPVSGPTTSSGTTS